MGKQVFSSNRYTSVWALFIGVCFFGALGLGNKFDTEIYVGMLVIFLGFAVYFTLASLSKIVLYDTKIVLSYYPHFTKKEVNLSEIELFAVGTDITFYKKGYPKIPLWMHLGETNVVPNKLLFIRTKNQSFYISVFYINLDKLKMLCSALETRGVKIKMEI